MRGLPTDGPSSRAEYMIYFRRYLSLFLHGTGRSLNGEPVMRVSVGEPDLKGQVLGLRHLCSFGERLEPRAVRSLSRYRTLKNGENP
jgi:hypothetical protein